MKDADYIVDRLIAIYSVHDDDPEDYLDEEEQTMVGVYAEILERPLTNEENKRIDKAREEAQNGI